MNKGKTIEEENKNQHKQLMIEIVKKEKPETTKQLITFIQERLRLEEEEINKILLELENEGKLHFTMKKALPTKPVSYIISGNAAWYWVIIALSIATGIAVFAISENSYPLAYLRSALGIIFILFLPGFSFMKTLFPLKAPISNSGGTIDNLNRAALSIGMSLVLIPLVGLILHYTPYGIRLAPITLSLLVLTVTLSTAAVLREYQAITKQQKVDARTRGQEVKQNE